ncbi:MAG: putative ubiquinone biosynthesis monooxygenase [Chrysothrix sp. TS-e1954]|nr:MAG: putative ubiquinone biosynthesis monooxygenase [Chrysothrix sp. TS-e1954]
MAHDRVQPYNCMNVWDGISGEKITFDWGTAYGLPSFVPSMVTPPQTRPQARRTIAHMTENTNLTSALLRRLEELGKLQYFSKTRVESIELGEEGENYDMRSWPILQLSTGETLAARLLVGADGPNSAVRSFNGIESHGWDYERHGVVATLRLDGSDMANKHGQITAYQRFLPTGPVALLPLPNGFASLVWSTTPSHASRLKTLSSQDLVAMFNAAFRLSSVDLQYMHTVSDGQADELDWREQHTSYDRTLVPNRVTEVLEGTLASFPLRMRHADTYVGERVALAGDAAHTIHPLAGQGLNLGLADVASLASVIGDATSQGSDIGSTLALEPYASQRYAANHVMLGAVDKLHKLYSFESAPIVAARSLGLGLVERWGGLKGLLMGRAAGS